MNVVYVFETALSHPLAERLKAIEQIKDVIDVETCGRIYVRDITLRDGRIGKIIWRWHQYEATEPNNTTVVIIQGALEFPAP